MKAKKLTLTLLLCFSLLLGSGTYAVESQDPITVACVGDSLTVGTGSQNPRTDAWPAVLQTLNARYETSRFSVYGTTVNRWDFRSFRSTRAYSSSLTCDADVYLVMLGSNDTLIPHSFSFFYNEYISLLRSYMELEQSPQVIVLLPPDLYYTNFLSYTRFEIGKIRFAEKSAADELGLSVIDLSQIPENMEDYCVDGGHFNTEGYAVMAQYICDCLDDIL